MFHKIIFTTLLITPCFLFAGDVHLLKNNFTANEMVNAWVKSPRQITVKKTLQMESEPLDNESSSCPAHNQIISLNISFKNNQYLLNRGSFQLVGKVANAMNDLRLLDCHFLIEGHTNSIGSARSNLRLSKERAKTVEMLLTSMNIKSDRLATIGKGESNLLLPKNGRAAANRRVQFRILNPNL